MKMLDPPDMWQGMVDDLLQKSSKPLIVIVGPTASGKTGLSIEVAKYINNVTLSLPNGRRSIDVVVRQAHHDVIDVAAEIINADSRQLYRHMTIGTAKITEEEMQGIPHHLIDLLDPNEEINIAWYKEKATAAIDDCHKRGVVPILVGGSMLYVSAVVDGLDPLSTDVLIRERLEKEYDVDDGWTLYDRLMQIDPATGGNFQQQNKRYVVRALELYELTGQKPSTLKKTIPPPYDILIFGMHWPRESLTRRIDERTKILLQSGWIEEVEGLLDRGYTANDAGMKSHGYREIIQWLSSEDRDLEQLAEVISRKTRAYAKRQMTWWGDDERIWWIKAVQ